MAFQKSYRIAALVLCLTLSSFFLSACAPSAQIDHRATPETAGTWQKKPLIKANNAMISVANPHAAKAGLKILKEGGSALDAAIAAQMVLNLVEPQSSGIGGGGFLLVFDPKTQKLHTYDGRETAPAKSNSSLFIKEDNNKMGFFEAAIGGRAVGTPGLLSMLSLAHQKHGNVQWASLFEDAITLSQNGFEVSPRLHRLIKRDRFLKTDPTARAYFYLEDGTPLPVGHLLKNPAFADSLKQIQMGGIFSFHIGQIADDIVSKVQNHETNPGLLSLSDIQNYKAVERNPVCLTYRAYDICGMGPPSSGGITVLETLGLIEQYRRKNPKAAETDSNHLLLEASKLAFADRNAFIGDEDFVSVPTKGLLSTAYLADRQSFIRPDSTIKTPAYAGEPRLYAQKYAPDATEHGLSTTHMSVVDKEGMVVSMTTSIENAFGSRQMVGGFLLNNQLTDFSFVAEKNGLPVANRIEPNKRPRSSMSPMIVFNKETGKPILAIGSPGGSRIIGYVIQSLIEILDNDLALDKALAKGHISNRNGASELEKGTEAEKLQARLEALGHEIKLKEMTSGLHAVQILKDGTRLGASDPRREGIALGY